MSAPTIHNRWLRPTIATLITLLLASTYMYWYLCSELRGNIDWFMLTAKKFGIPEVMVKHQQVPLYQDNLNGGWDGQFYFFIASDLLGNTDAVKHIDAPVYRYQRIGLPLTTAIVAKLTDQSWVSPKTYYFTYLALILFSTFALAWFFQRRGYSPWWALVWGLSYGVQLTLLNGLPDGAAEAYLALALITYVDKRYWLYALCATMSALSREAFIAIYAVLFVGHMAHDWRIGHYQQILQNWRKYIALMIPGILFLIWQIYIRCHFHASPIAAANQGSILGWPLFSFFQNTSTYLHDVVQMPQKGLSFLVALPHEAFTYQLVGLTYFIIMLIGSVAFFVCWLRFRKTSAELKILIVALLAFTLVNFFLGNTVMLDYTGSLKAINYTLLVLPFLACCIDYRPPIFVYVVFLLALFTGFILIYMKVENHVPLSIKDYFSNANLEKTLPAQLPCQTKSKTKFIINNIYHIQPNLNPLFYSATNLYLINVTIDNQNTYSLEASKGLGNFNLTYQIMNTTTGQHGGHTILTQLPQAVLPEKQVTTNMLLSTTKNERFTNKKIVIFVVQNGCHTLSQIHADNSQEISPTLLEQSPMILLPMSLSAIPN